MARRYPDGNGFFLRTPPPSLSGSAPLREMSLDSPRQLRDIRVVMRDLFAAHCPPGARRYGKADEVVLAVNELLINALQHGRAPIVFQAHRAESALICDVADHQTIAHPLVRPRRPDDISGRGLLLVSSLACAAGWYQRASMKHVWAQFSLD